ncbi:MAG: diacylglycerol kinase family lipid kinase [Myxococcales bacterium]|nr:diacylglycerol kinase family lipid kinase [Myxococcales bacterium]
MKPPVFIVNPNAANGAASRLWPGIMEQAKSRLGEFEVRFTARMGHAVELARQAAEDGARLVISVGGDGTMNEVVNGLMGPDDRPVNPDTLVGQICIGTGGDFRKTTGLPKEHAAALDWLAGEATRTVDVGRLEMIDHQGRPTIRYFINIASFGIGGEVDERVNHTTKVFGGFASFAWGALSAMIGYKNKKVRVILDDQKDLGEQAVFSVAVANGRFFGGGMQMAPQADLSDGLFDVVVIGDISLWEKITQMPKIYQATHLGHPKIQLHHARKIVAITEETVLLDVDGEAPGRLPATFAVCPGAIRIKIHD